MGTPNRPQQNLCQSTRRRQECGSFFKDHVYAVSNDNGNIVEHYRYTAFGEPEIYTPTGAKLATSAIDNPVLWSSRRYDSDTELYYYKYRHYKADIGRWLSRDPIEESGGINLYAFVGNEPIGRWDRLGLVKVTKDKLDEEVSEQLFTGIDNALDAMFANLEQRKATARRNNVDLPSDLYEFGGKICQKCVRGGFDVVDAGVGTSNVTNFVLPEDTPSCPVGYTVAGFYHSHGNGQGFSDADFNVSHQGKATKQIRHVGENEQGEALFSGGEPLGPRNEIPEDTPIGMGFTNSSDTNRTLRVYTPDPMSSNNRGSVLTQDNAGVRTTTIQTHVP